MELEKFIRDVPDFPQKGIMFKDITTLLKEKDAFKYVVDMMLEEYKGKKVDKIVGIESRGFILAPLHCLPTGLRLCSSQEMQQITR